MRAIINYYSLASTESRLLLIGECKANWLPQRTPCQPRAGAFLHFEQTQSASRIAASEEGVPAMFGGVVSLDLINAFATNRTKPNMNAPTAVPYITEAGT